MAGGEEMEHHSRRRLGQSFSSALLEAMSRSTDTTRDRRIRTIPEMKMEIERKYPHHHHHQRQTHFNGAHESSSKPRHGKYIHMIEEERNNINKPTCPFSSSAWERRRSIDDFMVERREEEKECARKHKPKQPLSPGSKLAHFFNSLFSRSPTSTKRKSQIPVPVPVAVSDERNCSSNTGYSRTSRTSSVCSKSSIPSTSSHVKKYDDSFHTNFSTPSSSSSVNNCPSARKDKDGKKQRSVTFNPTSVILDENARPCGAKDLKLPAPLLTKMLRVQFLEKGELTPSEYLRKLYSYRHQQEEDDPGSDSSSDLFELENLNVMDDLPVYETTHLETNRAIAKGLL